MKLCQQYFGTIGVMLNDRLAKYRLQLLAALGYLDQLVADADASLADPADADDHPAVHEIRRMLTDMRAKVEWKVGVLT
jgi:hypothetical protein